MKKIKYNANTEKQTKRTPQRDRSRGTGLRQILFQPSSPREVASLTSTKYKYKYKYNYKVQVQLQSTSTNGRWRV